MTRRLSPLATNHRLALATSSASLSERYRRPERLGGRWFAAHVEFDLTRQLDDGFRMTAVLEQRVPDGLRASDEQAAIETVLFLGDPVTKAVLANKNDGRCRAARRRFDELHAGIPSGDEVRALKATDLPSRVQCRGYSDDCHGTGDGLIHASNIYPAGYGFESDSTAIS